MSWQGNFWVDEETGAKFSGEPTTSHIGLDQSPQAFGRYVKAYQKRADEIATSQQVGGNFQANPMAGPMASSDDARRNRYYEMRDAATGRARQRAALAGDGAGSDRREYSQMMREAEERNIRQSLNGPMIPHSAMPAEGIARPAQPQGNFNAERVSGPAGSMQPVPPPEKPVSFQDVVSEVPDAKKKEAVETMESQGVDIEKAYADLMSRMGDKPDTSLSRQDKGMLLMEFGLHLMANSARMDTGSNIGIAGLNALQSYRAIKQGKLGAFQQQQQQAASTLEAARKANLEEREQRSRERRFMEGNDGIYMTDDLTGTSTQTTAYDPSTMGSDDPVMRRNQDKARRIAEDMEREGFTAQEAQAIATRSVYGGADLPGDVRRREREIAQQAYEQLSYSERKEVADREEYIDRLVDQRMRVYFGLESSQPAAAPSAVNSDPLSLR